MNIFSALYSNNRLLQPALTGYSSQYELIFINETASPQLIPFGQLIFSETLQPATCLEINGKYHIRTINREDVDDPTFDPDDQTILNYLYIDPFRKLPIFTLQGIDVENPSGVHSIFEVKSIIDNHSAIFTVYNRTFTSSKIEVNISFRNFNVSSSYIGQPDWHCDYRCIYNKCVNNELCTGVCGGECPGYCPESGQICSQNEGGVYSCYNKCSDNRCSGPFGVCLGSCNSLNCLRNGDIYECTVNINGCGPTCGWDNGRCSGECPNGFTCSTVSGKYTCVPSSGTCDGACGGSCYGSCAAGTYCNVTNGVYNCERGECYGKPCVGECYGYCSPNEKCVQEPSGYRCIPMDSEDECYGSECGGNCNGRCPSGRCIPDELGYFQCDTEVGTSEPVPVWVWILISIIGLIIVVLALVMVVTYVDKKKSKDSAGRYITPEEGANILKSINQ